MSDIPSNHKVTDQVTSIESSLLGKNEFKDHMNNIKACIDENRVFKENCEKLIVAYTAVEADLFKLSGEISKLNLSFSKLDTLEETNTTLQKKVDQQQSLIDEQKKSILKSDKEYSTNIEALKKQVSDLQKENSKKSETLEKKHKLICEAEEKREYAEILRVKNEQSRIVNEKSRKTNEDSMKCLKKSLEDKISKSKDINSKLEKYESFREAAEKRREDNENKRTKNESKRDNDVLNSSKLLSKRIDEIELKIMDMLKNDHVQTCGSSTVSKAEKINLKDKTKSNVKSTEKLSNGINYLQPKLTEEVNFVLPLKKKEFKAPQASESADTPILVKATEDAKTLQEDNKSIQGFVTDSPNNIEIEEPIGVVDNSLEIDPISDINKHKPEEDERKRELVVVYDLIRFEQNDSKHKVISVEAKEGKEESTTEKLTLLENKNNDQDESILAPKADIRLDFTNSTKLNINTELGSNVPDMFKSPDVSMCDVNNSSNNMKESNEETFNFQKLKKKTEDVLINPESPALKTNNDTFSGPTSETLIGEDVVKEDEEMKSTEVKKMDMHTENVQCEDAKARPI